MSVPRQVTEAVAPTLYHLVLFQSLDANGEEDALDRSLVRMIQHQLDNVITTPPSLTHIDVWIESPGGFAEAAYKLFLELRHRSVRVRSVIPDYAKSAATLFVLGTDKIFMAAAAELGPLDVQIQHPDREGMIISGLDMAGSLEFLVSSAVRLTINGGGAIVYVTQLPRLEVLQATLDFMAKILQPVVAKLDPHLLHKATKQLDVAERYAITMLQNRAIPEGELIPSCDPETLVRSLVKDYPAHEFLISRSDARELGLPVEEAENHPRWPQFKRIYDGFVDGSRSLTCIIKDSDVEEVIRTQYASDSREENNNEEGTQNKSQEGDERRSINAPDTSERQEA